MSVNCDEDEAIGAAAGPVRIICFVRIYPTDAPSFVSLLQLIRAAGNKFSQRCHFVVLLCSRCVRVVFHVTTDVAGIPSRNTNRRSGFLFFLFFHWFHSPHVRNVVIEFESSKLFQ